jgi:uncharacterized metal-binding protein YceD (DUF177 family)
MTKDFSRPIEIDRIPRGGSDERVVADAKECLALADILKVPAVHALRGKLRVAPWQGGGIKVSGKVVVDMSVVSVISLESFRTTEEFDVERYFVKERPAMEDDSDTDLLKGRFIDIGAICLETVGLEMEPYPRKPGEEFETVIDSDAQPEELKPNPFAKLAGLKDLKS